MILLPIIVLQLVIGTLIVQRYFFQMTDQLTRHATDRISYTYNNSANWGNFIEMLRQQGFAPTEYFEDSRLGLFDITGRRIRTNFEEAFGAPVYVDNRRWGNVEISFIIDGRKLALTITRPRLAPINPHQILLNTTGFAIIMTLFSMLFLRNQTRSLARLSHAAKAFGRGQTVNYIPTGALEVRSAGRSFLAMRQRISRQREQRNLLLSGVSHDLRTPLTRMRLSLELSDDETLKAELLEDIKILEELSESFLSYAANDFHEEFETRNLREEIIQIAKAYPKITKTPSLDYDYLIRPLLFRRAIENLLNNATRYAETIEISLQMGSRGLTIFIDDDGLGIPSEDRARAFQAFVRLDPAREQSSGGHSGLGLAIAADAIRQHGGEIDLNDAPIGGLRVAINLPKNITDYEP